MHHHRPSVHHIIIATARVLPKATQRELFRLGAYPRYSQSHYWQRYFSELWFWSILGIIAHMVSQVIAIFTESLQHKTVYNSLMDISHTYNSPSDVTIHEKMYYNCQRKMRQLRLQFCIKWPTRDWRSIVKHSHRSLMQDTLDHWPAYSSTIIIFLNNNLCAIFLSMSLL